MLVFVLTLDLYGAMLYSNTERWQKAAVMNTTFAADPLENFYLENWDSQKFICGFEVLQTVDRKLRKLI